MGFGETLSRKNAEEMLTFLKHSRLESRYQCARYWKNQNHVYNKIFDSEIFWRSKLVHQHGLLLSMKTIAAHVLEAGKQLAVTTRY